MASKTPAGAATANPATAPKASTGAGPTLVTPKTEPVAGKGPSAVTTNNSNITGAKRPVDTGANVPAAKVPNVNNNNDSKPVVKSEDNNDAADADDDGSCYFVITPDPTTSKGCLDEQDRRIYYIKFGDGRPLGRDGRPKQSNPYTRANPCFKMLLNTNLPTKSGKQLEHDVLTDGARTFLMSDYGGREWFIVFNNKVAPDGSTQRDALLTLLTEFPNGQQYTTLKNRLIALLPVAAAYP
ncbi:hypothetical protein OC845_000510 [Tilletia horrida]|nr:hypothetical protein OC845_000510 [Tilletia horrida]